jgi:hypothetical protein
MIAIVRKPTYATGSVSNTLFARDQILGGKAVIHDIAAVTIRTL